MRLFLTSVATNGKDGCGLKPQLFQVIILRMQKLLWFVLPCEI